MRTFDDFNPFDDLRCDVLNRRAAQSARVHTNAVNQYKRVVCSRCRGEKSRSTGRGRRCGRCRCPPRNRSSSARSVASDNSISSRVITVTGTVASLSGISVRVAVTIIELARFCVGRQRFGSCVDSINAKVSGCRGCQPPDCSLCLSSACRPHALSYVSVTVRRDWMDGFRCTPEPAPAAPFVGTQGRSPG